MSFVTGSHSVNKQDLRRNLKFFQVPEASIQSIYSKLAIRVFDVYANILKCMYSTRFNGGSVRGFLRCPIDLFPPLSFVP